MPKRGSLELNPHGPPAVSGRGNGCPMGDNSQDLGGRSLGIPTTKLPYGFQFGFVQLDVEIGQGRQAGRRNQITTRAARPGQLWEPQPAGLASSHDLCKLMHFFLLRGRLASQKPPGLMPCRTIVSAAPGCQRRAPLTNPADSLICGSNTTYKLLVRSQRNPDIPASTNRLEGWFGYPDPGARRGG